MGTATSCVAFASSVHVALADTSILDNLGAAVTGSYQTTTGDPSTQLYIAIGTIIGVILSFLGIIFFILTLYAGFLWMTAGGNSDQVEKAQNILQRSVIGLLIIFAAGTITILVLANLNTGFTSSTA